MFFVILVCSGCKEAGAYRRCVYDSSGQGIIMRTESKGKNAYGPAEWKKK